MTWWQALIHAGAVAATGGRRDDVEQTEQGTAELVEDAELQAHPIPEPRIPSAASFLNGIERWSVVAYDGVVQIVNAHVAAAVCRRDRQGVLHTTGELHRSFALAPLKRMSAAMRQKLEQSCADIEPVEGDLVEQPARYLEMIESTVRGRGLERALTLPAGHRTSVFLVRGGHTRTEVYSWYLRLWPWEGNDLLYGLLRIEARADPETVRQAGALSGWLWAERAPLATPATRWDRLLYPLHHVEAYLNARAPRDLPSRRASSRLPRLAS